MELKLDAESERIVSRHLASGRYLSPAEVVNEALQLLETDDGPDLDELRREIAIGIEQADRGDLLDGRSVFEKRKGRLASVEPTR